ncbi:MAG: putative glycoside hydrolase [Patescibacteria group bacterium]|nr:putative glycoside hydrolase family 15 protein [Patescibacteria group bacterium]
MLNKKNILIFKFLFIFSFVFFNSVEASDILNKANKLSAKSPKLANIFLSWDLNDEDVLNLSKWDLIILDMEHQFNNPDKIKKIRELNPDIIILAYISSQEIRNDVYLYDYLHLRKEILESIPDSWYLKFDNKKISFWPETWMLNSSNLGATVDDKRWNDFLPEFVSSRIIASGVWDGVFFDNFFDSINWLNEGNIDLNNDGFKDSSISVNSAWQEGNIKILKKTRELIGYDYIVLINSSSFAPYQKYVNGRVFEDFPISFEGDGSWQANINSYQSIYNLNTSPKFYIFNLTNNSFSDYEKMRYGLSTSLFFNDVYLSFDDSIENHGQTWVYEEYNFDLSSFNKNAYQIGKTNIWRKDFRYFSSLVNIGSQEELFELTKDEKQIYDWYPERNIKIKPFSSIIIEPILKLDGTWLNKTRYQAFNYLGRITHSNYVINNNDFTEKAIINYQEGRQELLSADLSELSKFRENKIDSNNNGFLERVEGSVTGNKSLVKIFNQENKLVGIFRAFPDQFKCGAKVSVGDIDGDGQAEIVTLPDWGGPHVRIFDFFGNLKYEFFAGDKKNRSFYDLNLRDIDFDGQKKEILIATY